ncbi:hypothetical protein HYALB_00011358 [Hymenoscyphus albidus]|uniref:O-methyltransferase C-terminal domain-containing protein n=1 Tax=Hymenoscyphus albidus TaxID=595503 RepID=A0A9N9LLF7_9HELO|nr:hypothetical protein HYALB_00011358 [Hymenoscyphus albidus]
MSLQGLTTLSESIAKNTKILTDHLQAKGLEAPSFSFDGLVEFPVSPNEEDPWRARQELIRDTRELNELIVGPKNGLMGLGWDSVNSLSLQAIYEFHIAEHVPADGGTISYAELADKCGIPLLKLRPLIRHAILNRLFCEPDKGFVAHTSTSLLLIPEKSPSMHAWIGLCNDLWKPVSRVLDAMRKWPNSQESNETGANLANETDLNWYDFIQKKDGMAKRYGLAMQAHSGREGFDTVHTVEGYPWGELQDGATVVDMGGSQGHVSIAVAEAYPKLKFIVQDTEGMRQANIIGSIPKELQGRVQLTTHDFFTPQIVVADVYFFRWIFHGFSEKYCIKILRELTPALKKGARILINDGTLPDPGTVGYEEEKSIRILDVIMQVTVNARERELEDWAELFAVADSRYKFLKAWKPEKSRMWFIEAEWTG